MGGALTCVHGRALSSSKCSRSCVSRSLRSDAHSPQRFFFSVQVRVRHLSIRESVAHILRAWRMLYTVYVLIMLLYVMQCDYPCTGLVRQPLVENFRPRDTCASTSCAAALPALLLRLATQRACALALARPAPHPTRHPIPDGEILRRARTKNCKHVQNLLT